MCGIFGFIGNKQTAGEIVAEGLKRLDYRGYDSWGVGVATNKGLIVKKAVGKIGNLKNLFFPSGSSAIAHTRWATTGAVSKANAHPHFSSDQSFILAHNGIVENFSELKKTLQNKRYQFISQTDTEVIVRQIEDALKTKTGYLEAIRTTYAKIEGRNTVILLTKTGEIYAARNGSPLVIGINSKSGAVFLSSDALSFASLADQMIVVENKQLVWVNAKGQIKIFALSSRKPSRYKIEKLAFAADQTEKGNFAHFMIKEIFEIPLAITHIKTQNKQDILKLARAIKKAKQIYTIGSGTAGFAAAQIAFYLRLFGRVNAIGLVGADARSYYNLFGQNDLIIAPSQSGETADVIEVLEYAKQKGVQIASIVNMPGSIITRMSDYPFMSRCGPEICVLSTKVFISQIAWGYLISKAVQGEFAQGKTNLTALADATKAYLQNNNNHQLLLRLAEKLIPQPHLFLLGKYQNLAIVNEGMVKIIEGAYIHAHALPAGDLKHYAITLVEKGVPVIAVVSNDIVKNDLITAINEVRLRGAEVIAIAHEKLENYDYYLPTTDTKETDAIGNVVPLQLLAYYLAVKLGNDVDKPRNIAKSVTVK